MSRVVLQTLGNVKGGVVDLSIAKGDVTYLR